MCWSATRNWSRPAWTCWTSRRLCSCRAATMFLRFSKPRGAPGASARNSRWRSFTSAMPKRRRLTVCALGVRRSLHLGRHARHRLGCPQPGRRQSGSRTGEAVDCLSVNQARRHPLWMAAGFFMGDEMDLPMGGFRPGAAILKPYRMYHPIRNVLCRSECGEANRACNW